MHYRRLCVRNPALIVLIATLLVLFPMAYYAFHYWQPTSSISNILPPANRRSSDLRAERSHQRWNGSGVGPIPKLLHFVFKDEQAFESYRPLIQSCLQLNPHWQVLLWRDSDSERLIRENYKYFADKYASYKDRLEKSDSVRYIILHKFGGIYLNMDVQCLRPFDQLLQLLSVESGAGKAEVSAFLGEERREQTRILYGYSFYTMNSLMGSRPGHPFLQFVIHRMQAMPNLNHARLSTGPDFLTRAYSSWVNCTECQADHPVTVFPARLVSPLMDTSLVNWQSKCEQFFKADAQKVGQQNPGEAWKAKGCAELVAKRWQFDDTDNGTVAVHRFLHLGYGSQGGRKTFDLIRQFPRIQPPAFV